MSLEKIISTLENNTSITSINLSNNSIGAEGGQAIAEALQYNTSITSVDLADNNIGAEGARAIAEVLKESKSITSVDLGGSVIGDQGARAIAEVLKESKSITSINLSDNSIGAEGGQAIAEALKGNTYITSINLSNNYYIKYIGAQTVEAFLFGGMGHKYIALGEESKYVAQLLSRNKKLQQHVLDSLVKCLSINPVVNSIGQLENKDAISHNRILSAADYNLCIKNIDLYEKRLKNTYPELYSKLQTKLPDPEKNEVLVFYIHNQYAYELGYVLGITKQNSNSNKYKELFYGGIATEIAKFFIGDISDNSGLFNITNLYGETVNTDTDTDDSQV